LQHRQEGETRLKPVIELMGIQFRLEQTDVFTIPTQELYIQLFKQNRPSGGFLMGEIYGGVKTNSEARELLPIVYRIGERFGGVSTSLRCGFNE